jgi:curved DNA-binding protein CbpA
MAKPTLKVEEMLKHYAFMGLKPDADEAAIRTAYRNKARELHPDKNRDNPKAGMPLFCNILII